MSLVINTNISSLNTQNNLSKSQSMLSQATERLSSGLKINSAADNAAGFAISQRYTTQIGGLNQASANASDAINLAQTAGSALDQVTANLQAIRDLAAQSANGTYSASDRQTIDAEVQQRLSEVTRIANQTTFNGTKVLDGSFGSKSFQIGANVGQTVSVGIAGGVRADQMGAIATTSSGDISAAFGTPAGISLKAGDLSVGGASVIGNFTTASSLVSAINTALGGGTQAAATGGVITITNASSTAAIAISGSNTLGLSTTIAASGTGSTSDLTTPLAAPATTGGTLTLAGSDLVINGKQITGTFDNVQALSDAINATTDIGVSSAVNSGGTGFNLYSASSLTASSSATGGMGTTSLADTTAAASASNSLQGGDVLSVDDANALMSRIDVALTSVASLAANLGAVQNRFQSTISTLSAQTTNLQASQSTIQDADFAAETANLSKAQVLQQAGISVLAQANANPQQVLKLLQ